MELRDLKLTKRRRKLLEDMGIHDLDTLLRTYPLRYENVEARPYAQWQTEDNVAFEGVICTQAVVRRISNNRSLTIFSVMADQEQIEVTLFNRPWVQAYPFGRSVSVFGVYRGNNRVTASTVNFHPLKEQEGMRPVYSLNKEMKQSDMKSVIAAALPFSQTLPDPVPERYRQKYRLLSRHDALRMIHQPKNEKELAQAVRTLKYEEFLCFQCSMLYAATSQGQKKPKIFDRSLIDAKIASLPFTLTEGQKQALEEVLADMADEKVMYRMVQGDVGCGKTMVAALSLYACQLAGYQAAFLAPTEILASQHVENLRKLGMDACLLASSLPAAQKRRVLADLKSGKQQIVCGTHALFQEGVEFARLGLVVADEQQRFGVKQRRSLLEKGENTDFLMMSATPIPRTYAHFLFGDIAMSSIRDLPPGREPVYTEYVASSSMKKVLPNILKGIQAGRQAYVVCPSIEENEEAPMSAAKKIYEGMVQVLGGRISIGLLHGKMKANEKEAVMADFARGKIQILVSTTVIEVGIDVANATMMVIYDAHRFGLSTLHQLRGRTARGRVRGECYLLSSTKDPAARQRLKQMETMLDGFSISQYDLNTRGPGDLLGVRQSGLPAFVLGSFQNDTAVMEVCWRDAREILERKSDRAMMRYLQKAMADARYMD